MRQEGATGETLDVKDRILRKGLISWVVIVGSFSFSRKLFLDNQKP